MSTLQYVAIGGAVTLVALAVLAYMAYDAVIGSQPIRWIPDRRTPPGIERWHVKMPGGEATVTLGQDEAGPGYFVVARFGAETVYESLPKSLPLVERWIEDQVARRQDAA